MEVTRKNFKDSIPLISDSIKKADFLVIDAEFTGLINGKDVSMFDTPQEYYTRLLNGSSDFLLIQYGLCAFYWDDEKGHYMNDAYNFYLFPRGRPGPEKLFLCQSSSLDFLSTQGFDFNKLIREGISYMTEPTESRLRDNLTERQKYYSQDKTSINIPEEFKEQIEHICIKVQEFLSEKKSEEMEIDKCNSFVRRLLFQELGRRYKDEAFIETKVLENKNRVLKVTRLTSANEAKDRDLQKIEKEWEDFEDAVGFSKVARMISQSAKLVIGHNMLLDMIHTLNHFFQPLPTEYTAFKDFVHCMFPRLLDTKYMSSLPPFKDKVNSNVLSHLLATLSEAPFSIPKIESEEGRGYRQTDDKSHEAGYDAYITGLCFLAMHSHLARMRGDPVYRVREPDGAALKPFLNKLFLARTAHQDSPYINLTGEEPTPPRDHVFFLTFPKEWQRNDLNQLFSPFGAVTVQFLDDTSAIIALSKREQTKDVVRILSKNKFVKLTPFVKYKHNLTKNSQHHQDKHWRKQDQPAQESPAAKSVNKTQKSGKVNASSPPSTPVNTQRSPLKLVLSTSYDTPPVVQRKRTSSGVFQQIDETEPPLKKMDHVRSVSEGAQKQSEKPKVSNGRRKTVDGEVKHKGSEKTKQKEKDSEEKNAKKSQFVFAFKESENWE